MKRKKLLIFVSIITFIVIFLYIQNNLIEITKPDLQFKNLPKSFHGYKIVHLSDLHSKAFGKEQKTLVKKIESINPDLIVFTGDLVDSKKYDAEISMQLLKKAKDIAPVYYVTGNHEWWSGRYEELEKDLLNNGIKVLRNSNEAIEIKGEKIYILGIDDPAVNYSNEIKTTEEGIKASMKGLKEDDFKILLAHRPEKYYVYSKYNIDLVLSGHAHGGQVRLPFIGGLVAPNQGYFPKYTAGKYEEGNSVMVVSRGLGNSIIPQRIFNRPEVVVITLNSKKND